MVKFINLALQLVIILILLKICFDLSIVAVMGLIKALPALVLTTLALLLLGKLIDDDEEEE
mgnify:CR=1 FL=1